MNIKPYVLLSAFACTTFASMLHAEGTTSFHSMKPRFYFDVGLGHAFDSQLNPNSHVENAELDNTESEVLSMFPRSRPLPSNFTLEAGFLWSQLYQADSNYFPFISLGLHYQYANLENKKTLMEFDISDDQYTLAESSNYEFLQNSLLANLKVDIYRWGRIMPYVNLGLGASWNQAKQQEPYVFDVLPGEPIVLTSPNSRNTSFSYGVGAGLDFLVSENFWLSLGYNYNNFGRVKIDPFETTHEDILSFSQPFNLRNLTTQTVQLTGRYVFG
ncbi:uncharacterized protein RVIR1_11640 [Candidatus Rickettsiella viridis]|uniref:Outer membrane protein beta-barrel domain-containing protein n=1 Tax=Candidatus Rickettsiella viridis TaxID=676208 RepID=A0A2Z5V7N0_9COXI|nr:outer membrane beta-barrel protein [Candidatus Rickettsiella viridis]BBB15627.1 uncharacterized protein RVIR1_11640 [Candidatus Rickettsiella viridis]